MKLSSPLRQIKRAAPAALALVFTVAAGCAPVVARAPFPKREDTTEPGDLLGPFDGRVVDTLNGKPLGGALVQASWAFETGAGLTAPAGALTATAETDRDGRYHVDRLASYPGPRTRVERFTLIVYKRGYVAYRSDRVFEGMRARSDFTQTRNVVRLERMGEHVSRVEHVRFIGGTGALRRALGSEIVEASLELLQGPPKPNREEVVGPPLDASVLLSSDELRAVTGYQGKFAVDRLGDLPTTSSYDSRHFKAVDKAETFDAALRAWKLDTAELAEERYGQLLKDTPNAAERNEMADRSLRGRDGRIVAVAALDRSHGVVVMLTCGLDQCRDADQAAQLLKRVMARANRLGRGGSEAPVKEPAEPAKQPTEPSKEPTKEPTPELDENQFKLKPPELKR